VSGTEATFSQGAVGGVTDGGVKLAIETSIIQACNRLDVILGEKGNWNNKVQEEMFRAVTKTHTLQHSFWRPNGSPLKPCCDRLFSGSPSS
jgi:hypothetical protein